ncbi:hypothetical protein GCM10009104_16980 [Marinobacterium maritimum]|uniref:Porin domain-containing protein n=1 Tax=Marinobacterium maritimum TaxID=500162 RepID=A0ABP3TB64_9GAMM
MKFKSTYLAFFVLLAPSFTQASEFDYNFYGSLRVMVEEAKHDNGDNFKDAVSRIGVSGSHDLGKGLQAFAKYELSVDVAEGELGSDTGKDARQAYVGLSGDYGSLMLGRYWSSFYNAIGYASDTLWIHSAPVYYTLDWDYRIGKSVMYTTPDMNSVQVSALYSDEREQGQLAATWQATDSLKLAAGYIDDADNNDSVGLAAYYTGSSYYLNAMLMDKDNQGRGIDLIGGISADKHLFTAGVSTFEDRSGSDNDFDVLILAYQYNLHPKVKLWVEAKAWDGVLYGIEDSNLIALGMNYDF